MYYCSRSHYMLCRIYKALIPCFTWLGPIFTWVEKRDRGRQFLPSTCYQYSDSVLSGKEKQLWQVEKWDFGDFPTLCEVKWGKKEWKWDFRGLFQLRVETKFFHCKPPPRLTKNTQKIVIGWPFPINYYIFSLLECELNWRTWRGNRKTSTKSLSNLVGLW